jgi:putative transcriptional regulator
MSMIYRYLHLCLLSLLLACAIGANDSYAFAPDKGMLLIANEQLADPRFNARVILLIQHDTRGTVGLVVNRNRRLPMATVLPEGSKLARHVMTLSYGGPVEPQTLLALVKVRNYPPEPSSELIDGVYVTGLGVLDKWPEFADEVVDYRAFVGYAGWAPGQLGAEMQRGGWYVMPADEESIFAGDDVELWERLRKMIPQKD